MGDWCNGRLLAAPQDTGHPVNLICRDKTIFEIRVQRFDFDTKRATPDKFLDHDFAFDGFDNHAILGADV